MFTRQEFDTLVKKESLRLPYLSYPGLFYTTYPQTAFIIPDSEETLRISRALKIQGDNGLRFWVSAELTDNWKNRTEKLKPYLSTSLFQSLDEKSFNTMIEGHFSQLINPPKLPLIKDQKF